MSPIRSTLLTVVFCAWCFQSLTAWGAQATEPASAGPGGDFTLTRTDGTRFSLDTLRGKIVVLTFGYTSCPDVCPTTLASVSALTRALGPRAEQVVALFVSVDPRRDTPQKLRDYVKYFSDAIIGLTGSESQLRRVAKQYGTYFRYQGDLNAGHYEVDHSANIFIIDRSGQLARIIPYGMPTSQLIESVQDLLAEKTDTPNLAHDNHK